MGEASNKVFTLLHEEGEPVSVADTVIVLNVGSLDLLRRVKKFEGEDGKPVKDEAGGFGVQRRRKILIHAAEKQGIELLYKVIAALIEAIDRAFHSGDGGIVRSRVSSFVLSMPEVKVGAVLPQQKFFEITFGIEYRIVFRGPGAVSRTMPILCGELLQVREAGGIQCHRGGGLSIAVRRGWRQVGLADPVVSLPAGCPACD